MDRQKIEEAIDRLDEEAANLQERDLSAGAACLAAISDMLREAIADVRHPTLSLLVKLGSIAVHADELFDRHELKVRLRDPEVVAWLGAMSKMGLMPVKR